MNRINLEQHLLVALTRQARDQQSLGVDLGTTKTSFALARHDYAAGEIACTALGLAQRDGHQRIGFPSAVAAGDAGPEFGWAALARRGQRGFLPERRLFIECKNDIGLRYTYARAPAGFGNAEQVAAQLLTHLRGKLGAAGSGTGPVVVTVPASFHGAQRMATLRAAGQAFGPRPVQLMDEPYAAFLDLVWRQPAQAAPLLREDATVMVFDFGGGTCDVAIFRVDSVRGGTLGARLLGTSRYHRLGGGDIDRAIVHDVLVPQLLAENQLDQWALTWYDKRKLLEPGLLATAETLKLQLSRALAAHAAAGALPPEELEVEARPVSPEVQVEGAPRVLRLSRPRLGLAAFTALLRPFLDPDPPPEAGDEYVQRSSVFAPIVQALFRAGLAPEDLDGVLMCGSSALLPPVQEALRAQFPQAALVLLGDEQQLEGAVARGAALQALALQALGEPLIAPVSSAEISLMVQSGQVPLLRAGDAVPRRSDEALLLRPPGDSLERASEISVEIVADGRRLVGRSLWTLPPPVSAQDRLALEWQVDENQCLELRLQRLDGAEAEPFRHRFDAPLTHRDPGHVVRCRKLEREEAIRNDKVPREEFGRAFTELASDCGALGEYEKALHFVALAMQEQGATLHLLNLRGIYRQRLGNFEGAKESYEAAGECATTRFNLALLYLRHGRLDEALATVDSALALDAARYGRAMRGDILDKLGRADEARAQWQDAIAGQPDWRQMDDFELGWIERAAARLEQEPLREKVRELRKLQLEKRVGPRAGELPELVGMDLAAAV